jgi:hypothetical protein
VLRVGNDRRGIAGSCGRCVALAGVLILLLLLLLGLRPAAAAPWIGPAPDRAPSSACRTAPGCGAVAGPVALRSLPVVLDGAYVVRLVGGVLNAAAPALRFDAAVTPVPLPAAASLLIAGLGALGLTRRRSATRSARLRAGGALPAAPDRIGAARLRLPPALRRALRCPPPRVPRLASFAPGRAIPCRPCGEGWRPPSAVERGPPPADGNTTASQPVSAGIIRISDSPRLRSPHGGPGAAISLSASPRPAASRGRTVAPAGTTARTGRTRSRVATPRGRRSSGDATGLRHHTKLPVKRVMEWVD